VIIILLQEHAFLIKNFNIIMLGTLAISQVIVAVALTLTDHYFLCLWNVKILFFGYLEGDDFASVISKVS
jgi:hypothetical protein